METSAPKQKNMTNVFYKFCYGAFVLLAVYYYITSHQLSDVVGTLGVALVFDPFDQAVTFSRRPRYQQVWLIAHTIILVAIFILMLMGK